MTAPTRPGDALSDTQRRFLAAVMERLPREYIHEIYLFAPMKQGSVETGIAVVAMGEAIKLDAELVDVDGLAREQPAADQSDEVQLESRQTGSTDAWLAEGEHLKAARTGAESRGVETVDSEPQDVQTATAGEQNFEQAAMTEDAGYSVVSTVPERPLRYTIHTARYSLQLKGPERGKWDVDVVEEADAPLVSIDAVVRGVHRRSGEPSEVERLAPHDLARALGEIPWTSES